MRRELTSIEQDILRLVRGGGPYPASAVIVATAETHGWVVANSAFQLLQADGVVWTRLDGVVETPWTMDEIMQGWREA